MDVGPHPHLGLHTVTWLTEGALEHTDSLGTRQVIRPKQVNLMTAGQGVAHAEHHHGDRHPVGAQLWAAQPGTTRHGPPGFTHLADPPVATFGALSASIITGQLGTGNPGSPLHLDAPAVAAAITPGAERPGATGTIPLDPSYEHAVTPITGSTTLTGAPPWPAGGITTTPGGLLALGSGRDHVGVHLTADAHLLLIGGPPFAEQPMMWWNFVARTRAELLDAVTGWNNGDPRFGQVSSPLPGEQAPLPPWA
jgi:redox-sensitive bicupin YhaK (pirin superfamily)